MRLHSRVFGLAVVVILAAGCGDDPVEPEGLALDDLVGSWTASSILHTATANASQQFDIIAAGGEGRVTVLEGGRARTWLTLGTFSDEWDAQFTLNGNTLTSTPAEASRGVSVYTITLSGNTLTLTNTDSSFDFTLAGGPEVSTTQVSAWIRQ